ncbi:MAG TPA: site-specific integrase, partial [Prolixibacteraceae bacterium]|nr:site-specific integrase [Prolixibacteraceae bacterium]
SMRSTFNVLFYIKRNEPKKDGRVVIMVRITINGIRSQFSSKLLVQPEQWDSKNERVKGLVAEARNLNRLLENIGSSLNVHYNKFMSIDGHVTPERLKNIFLGLEEQEQTIISFFDKYNDQYKLKVGTTSTHKTYTRYLLTRERLVEFMKQRYNLSDMPINEMTVSFIDEFYLYIRNNTECNHNSSLKFLQRFRTILYFAKNNGLSFNDPFGSFRFRYDKVNRGYLDQDELDILYTKKFPSVRLSQVRDIFIFSCYTGLAYVDVFELTEDKIRKAFDGHLWIMTKRQKTDVNTNVRLLDIPLAILEKYKGKQKNGKVLPVISNQKINDYLEEIADICGIGKKITFHVARHTFASTVALGNDVPMESIQSMLGHADIKTTQIYAHVIDRKLSRDMDKMAKAVNNRNPEVNAAEIKSRMAESIGIEKENVLALVGDKSKIKYLVTDETYLFSKKGKLREIQERDFFISVVEQGFKMLYMSPNIKFATNGTEIIIGSKFFGEIMGGYYSLNNQVGVFDDFRYGIIGINELKPIVPQNQLYSKAVSE